MEYIIASGLKLQVGFREPGQDPDRCLSDTGGKAHQVAFVVIGEASEEDYIAFCIQETGRPPHPSYSPLYCHFYRVLMD